MMMMSNGGKKRGGSSSLKPHTNTKKQKTVLTKTAREPGPEPEPEPERKITINSIKVKRKDKNKKDLNKPVAHWDPMTNVTKLYLRDMVHIISSPDTMDEFDFYLENTNATGQHMQKLDVEKLDVKNYTLPINTSSAGKLIVRTKEGGIPVDIYFHDIKLDGIFVHRESLPAVANAYTRSTWDQINIDAKATKNFTKRYIYDLRHNSPTLIGEGGQGSVRRCYALETEETYAMKIQDMKPSHEECVVKKIQLQQQLACEVSGIPKIEDHFVEQGLTKQVRNDQNQIVKIQYTRIYEVQEYIDGNDLFDVINQNIYGWYDNNGNVINEQKILNVFKKIVHTLKYMHGKKILHRDIKPENIMICKDGIVYLVDFGLARENTNSSRARSLVGTTGYIAPEIYLTQLEFSSNYEKSADIYSVGMLLFSMFCKGCRPIPNETRRQPCTTKASPKVKYLLESMLNLNAAKRPTAEKILSIIEDKDPDFASYKSKAAKDFLVAKFPEIDWDYGIRIDLKKKNLTYEDASALCEFLQQKYSKVKYLYLSDNNIEDLQCFAEVLQNHKRLESLILSNNRISTGLQSFFEALGTNKTLGMLELSHNYIIDNSGIESLINVLRTNNRLRAIWLHNNQLSDDMKSQLIAINQYKREGTNGYQQVKGFQIMV